MAKEKRGSIEKNPDDKPTMEALRSECEKLAGALDSIEGYTSPHAARMAACAMRLGRAVGFTDDQCLELRLAALVHDIGEQALHLTFLRQDRPLNFTERLELWRHPVVGEQQAARRHLPVAVKLLIRWHHENWDGSGYPDALRGREIPLPARLLRAADVFCSLTAIRPFRRAHSVDEALEQIRRMAGLELDPEVAQVLMELEAVQESDELRVESAELRVESSDSSAFDSDSVSSEPSAVSSEQWVVGGAVQETNDFPQAEPQRAESEQLTTDNEPLTADSGQRTADSPEGGDAQ